MSYFDISAWYTDSMDIYRTANTAQGNLTVQSRVLVASNVPCRIYAPGKGSPTMRETASINREVEKVACALDVDIKDGDELYIVRGGALGYQNSPEKYYAGHPVKYYDPVGGAMTFAEHQEIGLMSDSIINTVATV